MESLLELIQMFSHICCDKALLVAVFLVIASILYYTFKWRGLPPGPYGLPFLGYWPLLKDETCHLDLLKIQKKYGDIFSFTYAGTLYINMGTVKAAREIHNAKADCFERLSDFSLLSYIFQDGIGFANGEPWKALKKFTVQQFKELGLNTVKEHMKGPMQDAIAETIKDLRLSKGEPVEIVQLLTEKCNSILRHTMFSENGITEQEMRDLNVSNGALMSFVTMTRMLLAGNLAKFVIFPLTPGYREAMGHHKDMENMLYEIVNRRKSSFEEGNTRDFIDAYFKERNDRRSKGDPTADYFTDKALVRSLLQFVGDGVFTVAVLVSSFLKYVVDHEEEQEKIYTELMEVIGPDREPTIEDKSKLSYTNAFILEILRTSDFFGLFPSQQCIKETTVRGYRIPKGAVTVLNIWACHSDPNVYEEPEKFNPLRFIAQDGKQRPELPVSFGIGKRSCMGDGFAMAQAFLFLTSIIKNFKLKIPESSQGRIYDVIMSGKMEVSAIPREIRN